jgi:hypothetical protein
MKNELQVSLSFPSLNTFLINKVKAKFQLVGIGKDFNYMVYDEFPISYFKHME